jgi:curli biogenesis system outer membrane secretion channel CsgG
MSCGSIHRPPSTVLLAVPCLVLTLASCASYNPPAGRSAYRGREPAMKPVVAVVDFENKAGFSGQWNLGEGMAEMLITQLMDTRQVTVLERQHMDDVLSEIVRQGQDFFRKEGRVERGRLKNAQYLIRGSVTDFTVSGDSSGWFSTPSISGWGRGSKARVAMHVKVSDVASGEILASVKTEGAASAGGLGGKINYKDVALGGDAYFRTPLGEATEKALRKATKAILKKLPAQAWLPRVAEAGPDYVVINGGANAGVREDDIFVVRAAGRSITDPVTGNVIEQSEGRVQGRLRVIRVNPTSAHAVLEDGKASRGDHLEKTGP